MFQIIYNYFIHLDNGYIDLIDICYRSDICLLYLWHVTDFIYSYYIPALYPAVLHSCFCHCDETSPIVEEDTNIKNCVFFHNRVWPTQPRLLNLGLQGHLKANLAARDGRFLDNTRYVSFSLSGCEESPHLFIYVCFVFVQIFYVKCYHFYDKTLRNRQLFQNSSC